MGIVRGCLVALPFALLAWTVIIVAIVLAVQTLA